MSIEHTLSCPKCATLISVSSAVMPLVDSASGEPTGAVLKRCHSCGVWSWMMLERQPTN